MHTNTKYIFIWDYYQKCFSHELRLGKGGQRLNTETPVNVRHRNTNKIDYFSLPYAAVSHYIL
jgi:hypothetical protein